MAETALQVPAWLVADPFSGNAPRQALISKSCHLLIEDREEDCFRIIDVGSGRELSRFDKWLEPHFDDLDEVAAFRCSNNGRRIVLAVREPGNGRGVDYYQVDAVHPSVGSRVSVRWTEHSADPAFDVSPDGRTFAYWALDQTVRLRDWESGSETEISTFQPGAIVFSPSGKMLMEGCRDGTLWRVEP